MKILDANEGLGPFPTFLPLKHWFLGFAVFLEFWWYMQYKIFFECRRPVSSATKNCRKIKGILFPQSTSKLELFSWFWRPRTHYLCIFPFFFWTYLAQKWSYNAILGLKMTTNTIPFQRAFDECCESNIYSVIIENPSFGDATRELHSSTLFWRKMAQTFVRVQNFHGAHVYPKFTVSGLKYSQHP